MNKEEARSALKQLLEFVELSGDSWHKKGYDFERRFYAMCLDRGHVCIRAPRGHFDFLVNGLRVQCKRLNPDLGGTVYVQPGSGPAYARGSFDVLAVESNEGLHIVPEQDIPTTSSGLVKAAISISFLRRYTDAWWVIESCTPPAGFERQLTLELPVCEEATDGR